LKTQNTIVGYQQRCVCKLSLRTVQAELSISATYAERNLLLVNMKEKDLLKIQPLPLKSAAYASYGKNVIFISGQNEREETTQDTIVTKNAA
jgi:hypothetical protein